LVLAQVGRL